MTTITAPTVAPSVATARPTVWGLTPTELHDHFWAARGIQVVRPGEETEVVSGAELFMLTAPRLLCIFRLRKIVDQLSWIKPHVMWLRLQDRSERGYQERIMTDDRHQFVRFDRDYGGMDTRRLARTALTTDPKLAELWQSSADTLEGWANLREAVPRERRHVARVEARTFDRDSDTDVARFVHELVQRWKQPSATITRARRTGTQVWHDPTATVAPEVRFLGPSWVGAGRTLDAKQTVIGPAVLWDAVDARPQSPSIDWKQLEPGTTFASTPRPGDHGASHRSLKRYFDIAFSLVAILLTLPIYPLVMLAIWLEDGRPFFFAHRRETLGGHEFWCLKFRSMRKEAEEIKLRLMADNQVDGPQFYIRDDPRVTRVGRFIRKTHLDELPQFFNVLTGSMSVVGPRPSPRSENQYCPPWRDARLSVRPGVTGLWQIKRTRGQDTDFQEWIRYDIEYVQNSSFRMDLWIIWRTIRAIVIGK